MHVFVQFYIKKKKSKVNKKDINSDRCNQNIPWNISKSLDDIQENTKNICKQCMEIFIYRILREFLNIIFLKKYLCNAMFLPCTNFAVFKLPTKK